MAGFSWTFTVSPDTITEVTVTDGVTTVTVQATGGGMIVPFFETSAFPETTEVTLSATGYNDVTAIVGTTSSVTFTEASTTPTVAYLSDGTNTYEIKDSQAREDIETLQTDKVDISDLTTCHVVTEAYHNGVNWYRVYSDGWCEQGQMFQYIANNTNITFLKPFASNNYSLSTTNTGTGSNAYGGFVISNITSTGFTITDANYGGDKTACWEAKGYIA